MRMAGINRQFQRLRPEGGAKLGPITRVDILDILHHKGHAQRFGPGDNGAQDRVYGVKQLFPRPDPGVQVVEVPGGKRRMDHHMGAA